VLASAGLTGAQINISGSGTYGIVTATATYIFIFEPAIINLIPGLPNPLTLTSTTSMRREY